ncbi:hypothetical protein QP116_06205 [Pseudoglutamicibacter cumminsii]|uniref:Uncharacterized protein n=1 Tax=Pseudoglutamicibacter cumminsii TaxID=156979 RepID=A0AAP4C6R1_9MICC|nr:hypothetical protein [Pseudoglutamicibacter cumminsii]MDK6275328.1 hypothetical protein [Pseudoglutamicibacter cumminsii]
MADLFDALGVGARVVARYRLPDERLTDALGEIVYIGSAEDYVPDADSLHAESEASAPVGAGRVVVVRTRRGDVFVPTARVTHAKPVPPPPQRRAPRRPAE